MDRRDFLKSVGAFFAVAAGPLGFVGAANKKWGERPNVLFIMADDHALEAISCYGSHLKDFARTPNIDRIANEGMRFENCCCGNSICSPSRASILTGQHSHKNGVLGLNGTINEGSPWFSAELQKAGYETCAVGKWHLKTMPKGFDDYWVTKGQGKYFDPTFYTPGGVVKKQGYSTDVYTDTALEWLRGRDGSKPFCLCLHFKAPHHPYDYPERHGELYEGVKIPEPASLYEDVEKSSPLLKNMLWAQMDAKRSYYLRHRKDAVPAMDDPERDDHRSRVSVAYQHMMKKYLRCITANDENVGRMLDYLDDKGLADNTVVVYTSDQGYWLGQHGLYDKRLILEGSLKMPFVVRYPREIKEKSVNDDLVMNIDFAETFIDYAGAKAPKAMQGRSLRPLLEGKTPSDWRDAILYCYWAAAPTHWGVRTRRYKLVCFPGSDAIEFYDLKNDPKEMRNVAGDKEYASAIAACRKRLAELMKEADIKTHQMPKHKGGQRPSTFVPKPLPTRKQRKRK
jgi:arylsulfatase A-like enzyme